MTENIFLIEDHDEALRIWRKKRVKNLNLVHIDAHMDFGFYQAKPIQRILNEARNLKELKKGLESSIAYMHYGGDFKKQTNIGNYIYSAIEEGIVNDFYWVIPGATNEFRKSKRFIKHIFKDIARRNIYQTEIKEKQDMISSKFFDKNFTVCTLEKLPILQEKVLLDIDTDFLVTDSLIEADNTEKIGERKPWILPKDLVEMLKQKIRHPEVITIAYSVNGGYTPIKYKHLGDGVAYRFAPQKFGRRFENNSLAAHYFELFRSGSKNKYYQKAVALNPGYRVLDNNYGPLYLSKRKFSLAFKEFSKILKADPQNPGCLLGIGNLALEKKDFKKAKTYFSLAISNLNASHVSYFKNLRALLILGLARAEFCLKNYKKAKILLIRYRAKKPLEPFSYYLLGCIFEKEKKFARAATFYKDLVRLDWASIEPLWRLLKISRHLKERDAIIKYIIIRYNIFKKEFLKAKILSLKKGNKIEIRRSIEKKIEILERRLN